MKLHSLLGEDLIVLHKEVATKTAGINLLLKELFQKYPFQLEHKTVEHAVFSREALGGTTFPTGIAIPHARLEGFNDLVVAILVPKNPIPDPCGPIRLLVLMLSAQSKPSLYLNTLGAFLKLSQNKIIFEKVAGANHPAELIEIIKQADFVVKKELAVEDIMNPVVVSVSPETTVKTLADLFYQHNFSYVPVVNENGEVEGEVSILDLLKAGFPDYTIAMDSLKFLTTLEPFEILLEKEEKLLVKDIMKPVSFACDPSTLVVELSFELMKKKRRHAAVIQGKRLVGIVSVMDVLRKVIRG